MDSLTVHYLARELDARWRGRRIRSCRIDRDLRAITLDVDGSDAVQFDLAHPTVRIRELAAPAGECPLAGWVVCEVGAPIDDRRLTIRFEKPGKFKGSSSQRATLDMSVIPTVRGALLVTEGGHRMAAFGAKLPPLSEPRPVLTSDELHRAAAAHDPDALMHGRWLSPILARRLSEMNGSAAVEAYARICALPEPEPSWCGAQLVPFPWCDTARPAHSLIERADDESTSVAQESRSRHARSVARMREELSRAAIASTLRRAADALMAMGDVPAPTQVLLPDGTQAPVAARAGESAVAVAERLYRDVRSMERALESLPSRIAALERAAPSARSARGATDGSARPTSKRAARPPAPGRPFRTYRSSGGLDIWVGRGAASNDVLTFREAASNDVWLHARDAAGAHVVLRWARDAQPPARDLEEAASLAAWHSKLRSSTLVPVDWTRRKHVRKVRGGAPGLVTVQRAQTVFVRPRAELERKLRA